LKETMAVETESASTVTAAAADDDDVPPLVPDQQVYEVCK